MRVRIEGRSLQEEAVGPLDRRVEGRRPAVVELDHFDVGAEQAFRPFGATRCRSYLGTRCHEQPNQFSADDAGRPGDQDSLAHAAR